MSKKTAIRQLIETIKGSQFYEDAEGKSKSFLDGILQQAEELEELNKQQIIDTYNTGELLKFDDGEHYYNETYNQK